MATTQSELDIVRILVRAGRYSQREVNRGLPAAHLVKYFTTWALAQADRRPRCSTSSRRSSR